MNQKSNKKGLITIISIILVIGIGAIGVYGYNQLVNKNPLVQYVTAEKNTFEETWAYYEDYYGDSKTINEKLMSDPYEATSTFSVNTDLPMQLAQADPMIGMIQGVISSLEITTDTKVNPSTKETYIGADVAMQGNSLLDGNIYQNEENTALQVPVLYDEYFVVNNKTFGEDLRQKGATEVPFEELPNFVDQQLSPEQLEEMAKDYLKIISDHLSEDKVEVSEGEEYQGSTYTKLSVHYTEEEVRDIFKEILTEMKNDERFTAQFGSAEIQKEEMDVLINNLDQLNLPNGLDYEAYMTKDYVEHRILSFDVMDTASQEEVAITFNMDTVNKGDDQYEFNFQVKAVPSSEDGQLLVQYSEDGSPDGEQYKVNHNLNVAFSDNQTEVDFGVEAETVLKENNSETHFNLVVNKPEVQEIPDVSGSLIMNVSDEDDKAQRDFEFGLDVAMEDPNMGPITAGVTLTGETEYTFTDNPEFPTIGENAVHVFEKSDQELQQILKEIEQNAMNYYQSMFGALGGMGGF
ncbi:DUF6583 family protein [Salinibacillus xinjiangensis]|uniref:Uncharacterized protein n=1 Tax=Salinibacillus xinjiangensis TaxID=1229268 RepID=A0A6G1X772_9BACI|nr:DUF6583 family protein [Salinibacillus xinjiangensis]MRG86853.1 hypothetical protein [Salinibacillus xinjiangensis]